MIGGILVKVDEKTKYIKKIFPEKKIEKIPISHRISHTSPHTSTVAPQKSIEKFPYLFPKGQPESSSKEEEHSLVTKVLPIKESTPDLQGRGKIPSSQTFVEN